jgi:hypothetical protein
LFINNINALLLRVVRDEMFGKHAALTARGYNFVAVGVVVAVGGDNGF